MEIIYYVLNKHLKLSIKETSLFLLFGYVILYLFNKLDFYLSTFLPINLTSFLGLFTFILIWFFGFILIKELFNFIFCFFSSFKAYNFIPSHWPNKWSFQGAIRVENDSLYITDSNSGCLLQGYSWKNFEMNFDCKFPKGNDKSIIGVIFRARNLSDYLMVQINNHDHKITPHIRMNGIWEALEGPWHIEELNIDEYFHIYLIARNEHIELFINDKKIMSWDIPTNSDILFIKNDINSIVPKINFRNTYGQVGFRAYGNEGAYIRNFKIKRLKSII